MPGRMLCSDEEAEARGFVGRECARRRAVLRETIDAFERSDPADLYHQIASRNLERWRESAESHAGLRVEVLPGDWGEVARSMTAKYGECFTVLNIFFAFPPYTFLISSTAALACAAICEPYGCILGLRFCAATGVTPAATSE